MKPVYAVIDSGFGDCGKGILTSYLANKHRGVVVRFNGSCQAGHTVVTPENKRHVFHHFGSGSLDGCPTHLSKYFLLSPMFYKKELKEILDLDGNTTVTVDPAARLVLPWDIMINQALENKRAGQRHGSTGMGQTEAIIRSSNGFLFTYHTGFTRDCLLEVRDAWVPERLLKAGLTTADLPDGWDSDTLIETFSRDCDYFYQFTNPKKLVTGQLETGLIFEGAQGIGLDMDNRDDMPHLTYSRPGLHNVIKILSEISSRYEEDDEEIDLQVYYVTRCYRTRHGAGPLKWGVPNLKYKIVDKTNVPNPFQGTMQYGYFNMEEYIAKVRRDLSRASDILPGNITITPHCAMTCLDQLGEGAMMETLGFDSGTPSNAESVARGIQLALGGGEFLVSYGPCRTDIKELK